MLVYLENPVSLGYKDLKKKIWLMKVNIKKKKKPLNKSDN